MRQDRPYMSGITKALKGLRKNYGFGSNDEVRHRCTCPSCGTKLVNLYSVNGKWRCAKCKEKEND